LAAVAVVVITGLPRPLLRIGRPSALLNRNRALTKVRTQLYRHVQYLSLSFHTKARTGDLVVRMMNDRRHVARRRRDSAVSPAGQGADRRRHDGFDVLDALATRVDRGSGVSTFWLRSITVGKRIREVAQKQRRREGAMAATFTESITAIRTVQALSLERIFARAFSSESEKKPQQDVRGKRLAASLERSLDVVIAVATAWCCGTARGWCCTRLSAQENCWFPGVSEVSVPSGAGFRQVHRRLQRHRLPASASSTCSNACRTCVFARRGRRSCFCGGVQFHQVTFAYERGQRLLENIQVEIQQPKVALVVLPAEARRHCSA